MAQQISLIMNELGLESRSSLRLYLKTFVFVQGSSKKNLA